MDDNPHPTGSDASVMSPTSPSDTSLVERLRTERDEAVEVLRLHHRWHVESGVIGLPDGDGGWIEMDNAAEYGDSTLYRRTVGVLDHHPPAFEPMPRGGWQRSQSHWENWQLAYRELRKEMKRAAALEARNRELEAGLPIVAYMKPDGEVLVPDASQLKELLAGLQPVPAPLGGAPLLPLRALTASRPKP